jgi:hypothetical protein
VNSGICIHFGKFKAKNQAQKPLLGPVTTGSIDGAEPSETGSAPGRLHHPGQMMAFERVTPFLGVQLRRPITSGKVSGTSPHRPVGF